MPIHRDFSHACFCCIYHIEVKISQLLIHQILAYTTQISSRRMASWEKTGASSLLVCSRYFALTVVIKSDWEHRENALGASVIYSFNLKEFQRVWGSGMISTRLGCFWGMCYINAGTDALKRSDCKHGRNCMVCFTLMTHQDPDHKTTSARHWQHSRLVISHWKV